jgi:hypothetical protein
MVVAVKVGDLLCQKVGSVGVVVDEAQGVGVSPVAAAAAVIVVAVVIEAVVSLHLLL